MAPDVGIEVIKIGGSLLTRSDFVPAIRQWLEQASRDRPSVHRVLIVGGGPLVEALRALDFAHPLEESEAHWQAIHLMQLTGQLVGSWMPDWPQCNSFDALCSRVSEPGQTLFLAEDFLRTEEASLPGRPLPVGWQVTSDSIAARVAVCLKAGRLSVVKSREPITSELADWSQAAAGGLVDEWFPQIARELREVRFEILPECCG